MARVTTKNGATFECGKGQSIIEAALEAGIVLEHSCISGRCDSCRARVLTGETELIQVEQVLGAGDIADKHILMCCRTAKTDLVLDVEGLTEFTQYGVKVLPCKIDADTASKRRFRDQIPISALCSVGIQCRSVCGSKIALWSGTQLFDREPKPRRWPHFAGQKLRRGADE